MNAEVYRWFTETSGLGPIEQAAKLMNPNQASKETDVAEAIEQWEEKVNRLARHGEEYQLNETFKNIASRRYWWAKSWSTTGYLPSRSSRTGSCS